MADLINFVSKRVIDAKKEEKRKAREQILKKAKEDYEREQRRKERRIESGESSWMLPSLSERLTAEDENDKDKPKRRKHKKEKKQKKDKKEKKHKKQKNRGEEKSSESESDDEWVEKGTNTSTTDTVKSLSVPSQPQQQRESWMLCPPITESSWKPMAVEEDQQQEETKEEEEDDKMKALSCIDRPGQHPRELNPYWKEGGTGLPSERETSQESTHREESPRDSFSSSWLKKAYQRAKEEAEEERKSLADIVAKRYGSVERLELMIREAEEREAKQRKEESNLSSRERYRADRDRHDHRKRDRDERRNKERSPDRYDVRKARSRDSSSDSSYRSVRDTEEHKWRRRDDEGRERVKHDSMRFLRPGDSDNRSSFAGKFKRPPSSSSTVTSSTWDFDPKEGSRSSERHSSDRPSSRPSGGWKKKLEHGTDKGSSPREEHDAGKESVGQEIKPQSETDSSSSSEGEAEENRTVVIPAKKITEKDLNDIGAKIVKAEIMGNEELAIKLKSQLEEMRKNKELQEAQVKGSGPGERSEEMVVLTRTDSSGNVWPLEMNERQEPRGGRRKRKKVETHGKEGTRERYFADDDRYDLKEMVRREKMSTADDQEAMMAKLASKAAKTGYSDDFTLDDRFVSSAANKISPADQEQRAKQRAIREHRMLAAQLSKCRFCFENPEIAKHLIIAIGLKVYLAVPLHESLTDGHCLIIPMQHCSASTMLDEDVCSEIQIYKKGLTKMFEEMEEDVVFLETCKQLRKQHHMIIECVPLPKETGDMAPVYFKKAILESETEWAQNKKLIDTRKKGLRAAVPKGLPYFSVEFGLDGGFAHVIEEEELFPHYFGKEILGGMLDLEPHRWRKPRRENFEEHKRKVLQFADWWKPFDWTQRIERK